MNRQTIDGEMRVWSVIQEHPETVEVFRRYGCPDMRSGIYALSAHVMKVRWAALAHHIALDELLDGLNQVVTTNEEEAEAARH